MAIKLYGATTVSVAANTKTANVIPLSTNAFIGKGVLTLCSRASATGLNIILKVGGVTIIDDQPHSFFGTTGGLDMKAHIEASQLVGGGNVELYYRNTTGGALTYDAAMFFEPSK